MREFALYGETTGETDEFGLPVRHDWAAEYRGAAAVAYGHTPVPEPEWLNNTINLDTGCAFGGRLTALRWPEREIVSVAARRTYAAPARPFLPPGEVAPAAALSAQQRHDDMLDIADVTGKRLIETRLARKITIAEERAITALEAISRFAVVPQWLVYLPPTMSPTETSALPGLLEHPAEAFAHDRAEGVPRVVCEEKHMGSRAIVIVCRDEAAARRRFGVAGDGAGICYTRTGRRGLVQPAVKCRGREYLRIIYGPEYDRPAHLERLRLRCLGRKRALALREFALGVEALERFARREPLRRVHECVFGVLALESEPVDPRL